MIKFTPCWIYINSEYLKDTFSLNSLFRTLYVWNIGIQTAFSSAVTKETLLISYHINTFQKLAHVQFL